MTDRVSECLLAPRYTRFIAFTSKNEKRLVKFTIALKIKQSSNIFIIFLVKKVCQKPILLVETSFLLLFGRPSLKLKYVVNTGFIFIFCKLTVEASFESSVSATVDIIQQLFPDLPLAAAQQALKVATGDTNRAVEFFFHPLPVLRA